MGKKDIRKQLTDNAPQMLICQWNPHRPQGTEQLTEKSVQLSVCSCQPLTLPPEVWCCQKWDMWAKQLLLSRSGNIWKVLRCTPVRGSTGCGGCVCWLGSCGSCKCSLVLRVLREYLLRWYWGDHGVVVARSRRQPEWPSLWWETRTDVYHRIQSSS